MTTCYTIICDIKMSPGRWRSPVPCAPSAAIGCRIYTLDVEAATVLRQFALERVEVFSPAEYIPPDVEPLRRSRSLSAFAFTLKPIVLLHATGTGAEWISYFDTDIAVFADPARLLEGLPPDTPALFTPHRFSTVFRYSKRPWADSMPGMSRSGTGRQGRRIVEDWRDRCVVWCQDYRRRQPLR